MHFVAHALDKPDALPHRMATIDAHRAYLDEGPARHGVRVLMSGPLITDDGAGMKGSFFLLDAPSRAVVEAMFDGDPMAHADVWGSLSITRVNVRQNTVGDIGDSV